MNKRQQEVISRVRATLVLAQMEVQRNGLAHGNAIGLGGQVCASQAISVAARTITPIRPYMTSTRTEAFLEMNILPQPFTGDIVSWNDHKDKNGRYVRTRKQVIALFDKAIKQLDAEPEKLFQ